MLKKKQEEGRSAIETEEKKPETENSEHGIYQLLLFLHTQPFSHHTLQYFLYNPPICKTLLLSYRSTYIKSNFNYNCCPELAYSFYSPFYSSIFIFYAPIRLDLLRTSSDTLQYILPAKGSQ